LENKIVGGRGRSGMGDIEKREQGTRNLRQSRISLVSVVGSWCNPHSPHTFLCFSPRSPSA